MTIKDTRDLITEAFEGDTDAVNEIHLSLQFRQAMEEIFEDRGENSLRNALIVIGKVYGGATVRELEKIFKIDIAAISRILQRYYAI